MTGSPIFCSNLRSRKEPIQFRTIICRSRRAVYIARRLTLDLHSARLRERDLGFFRAVTVFKLPNNRQSELRESSEPIMYKIPYNISTEKFQAIPKKLFIAPAGFWPRGQNPRRHPRSPRVYTYKDKEYLLKK